MVKDNPSMFDSLILETPNPLKIESPASSTHLPRRAKRRNQRVPCYDEESSEKVDNIEWQHHPQKRKSMQNMTKTDKKDQCEAATFSLDDVDPLSCNSETTDEGPEKIQPTKPTEQSGPLYKDPRRKAKPSEDGEEEIFENDDLLYCYDCSRDYDGDCPEHGPLTIIKDSWIPAEITDIFRAKKTTPSMLSIAHPKISGAGDGVWACEAIPARTRFGPYEGKRVLPEEGSSYAWLIRKNGKADHCIDASQPGLSNWMRYVNSAKHLSERNLYAFQYKGDIYFETTRLISPHEELLVWCGKGRSRTLDSQSEDTIKNTTDSFKDIAYPGCSSTVSSPLYLKKHNCRRRLRSLRQVNGVEESQTESPRRMSLRRQNKVGTPVKEENDDPLTPTEDCVSKETEDGAPFVCFSCNESFVDKDTLNSHLQIHSAEGTFVETGRMGTHFLTSDKARSFECPLCDYSSAQKQALDRHLRTHTGEKPFVCEVCEQRFAEKGTLVKHERTHSGEKPYACSYCDRRFTQRTTMVRHELIHTGKKPFECAQCAERFASKKNLMVHVLKKHSGNRPFACELCDQRFFTRDALERHERTHSGDKPFVCEVCERCFAERGTLIRHRRVHTGEKPYHCAQCNKRFTQRTSLVRHMRTHTGEEAFVCSVCNEQFGTAVSLKIHMLKHGVKKPFRCKICNEQFALKLSLEMHQRTHNEVESHTDDCDQMEEFVALQRLRTERKPYLCDMCDKGFNLRAAWIDHLLVHEKKMPFVCSECRERFPLEEQLRFHLEKHNKEKILECSLCDYQFVDKEELERHSKEHESESYECQEGDQEFAPRTSSVEHTHSNEKSYVCVKCDEKFSQRTSMVRHLRTHMGEKVECPECKEEFSPGASLKLHMEDHKEKLFYCSVCHEKFSDKQSLEEHFETHNEKYSYGSEDCEKEFSEKELAAHFQTLSEGKLLEFREFDQSYGEELPLLEKLEEVDIKPYICEECGQLFTQRTLFIRHQKIHSVGKTFAENKHLPCNENLKFHAQTHTKKKSFVCHVCSMEFVEICAFEKHLRTHRGVKSYICEVCDRRFTLRSTLVKHLRTHSGEKPYQCDYCSMSFAQGTTLKRHLRTHTGEKPYKCSECNAGFSYRERLRTHELEHAGMKPHLCPYCDTSFATTNILKRHLRTHSGERPFPCDMCDLAFAEKGTLTKHRRVHLGEKPYACLNCNMRFTQRTTLVRHMRTHTGEKPYSCSDCGKKFSQKATLRHHVRIHNKKQ